jgi:hypothetical protein
MLYSKRRNNLGRGRRKCSKAKKGGKRPISKIGSIQDIKRGFTRRDPIIQSFDGKIFDKEMIIDNNTKYLNCIFANGIIISTTITEIADLILFKCMINGPIIIPDNITKIGYKSFFECKVCENKLTLSNNIKFISDYAFYNSSFGKELFIPKSTEHIGEGAFSKCNNVISIQFDNKCTIDTIHTETFYNCLMVAKIILPPTIINIGEKAFSKCPFLTTVENIDNIKVIENDAFSYCFDLNMNVKKILQSAQTVNKTAFYGCKNITYENRPASNIFSKLFVSQFKFDLHTIPKLILTTPTTTLYGTLYGDSTDKSNINGFSRLSEGNKILIGDFINNARRDFVLDKDYKANTLSIIEYDNDMPKTNSYKFKIIPDLYTMYTNINKFEYTGDNTEMKGILKTESKVFIGIWNIKKDTIWYHFHGFVKEGLSHELQIIENGFHSFAKTVFYENEIRYLDNIDTGQVIIHDIDVSIQEIIHPSIDNGNNTVQPLILSLTKVMSDYRINLSNLVEYNIENKNLLPWSNGQILSIFEFTFQDIINIFNEPLYNNIYFKKTSEDSDNDSFELLIKNIIRSYNEIKFIAPKILQIYLTTYEKFIPIIETYFEELSKNKTQVQLPIHLKLHDILIQYKREIEPTRECLERIKLISSDLTVVKDGPNIIINRS